MITLQDVSLLTPGFLQRDPILLHADVTFATGERVGILAKPGTGKSSIARMLSGVEEPDGGTITRRGRVSWPIGFAGFLHPFLTVGENIDYFARLVGIDPEETASFCVDFCGTAGLLDLPMQNVSPTQRALLSYACAMAVDYPTTWIADEVITVGEPHDRDRCEKILASRLETGGLIFLSRNIRQLKQYCERFYVLLNCQLVPCDDLVAAQRALDRISA